MAIIKLNISYLAKHPVVVFFEGPPTMDGHDFLCDIFQEDDVCMSKYLVHKIYEFIWFIRFMTSLLGFT